MHLLNLTVHWFLTRPVSDWYHLGEFFLGGGGVAVTVQVLKHVNNWHGRKNLLRGLTTLFSLIVAGAQSYLHSIPPGTAVKSGLSLAVVSTFVYEISVSPLYGKFMNLVTDAETYRQSVTPQSVSPSGADVAAQPEQFPG